MSRRKLNRKLLDLLPDKLKFAYVRKKTLIEHKWPSSSLEIKIADNAEDLESAYRLLHDSYVGAGFMDPDPTGMRILPQHLLPQTTTIVAKWDKQVIGTLSLIRDNPFGLPLEKIFDVNDRRLDGRRLAEVSSLAVDPKHRGKINTALFPLFRFVIQYAQDYFGTDELVIAVNPTTVDLYRIFLCFEKLQGKAKSYDFVKGAPAVGLYMDYEKVEERWKKAFEHRPISTNYFMYWSVRPTDPGNGMPKRNYHSASDPILTPDLLSEFFLKRGKLADKLTYQEVQVLMEAYPFEEFQNILVPLMEKFSKKNMRIETQMKAELHKEKILGDVLNVSKNGLLLRGSFKSLNVGQTMGVTIWLNRSESTQLRVEVCWNSNNRLYGLKILASTNAWREMIDSLEKDHNKQNDNNDRGIKIAA